MTRRRAIFGIGLLGVILIIVLSLAPGSMRPHTPASGYVEHFIAYLGVATCLCVGASRTGVRIAILLALALMSGLLEFAQLYVPGRSGEIWGALASSAGAMAGGMLAPVVRRVFKL